MREVSVCNITADIVNTGTRQGNNSTRLHSKDRKSLAQKSSPNKKKYRGTVTTAPATITTAPFQSYDSIGPDNYVFI